MNAVKNDIDHFFEMIKKTYNECVGHETYGDVTEFYDEDGVVLMTARDQGNGKMLFSFGPGDEFEWHEVA